MSDIPLDLKKNAINYLQSIDKIKLRCENRTRGSDFYSSLFIFSVGPNISAREEKVKSYFRFKLLV